MNLNEQELQNKIEKIVENVCIFLYQSLKKNKALHRQRSSITEEPKDTNQELVEKEFLKSALLDGLLKQITLIIENLFHKHCQDVDNALQHLEHEIMQLKQHHTLGSQESTIRQTLVLSKNSSFTDFNESFLIEDQAKSLRQKIKQLKEQLNKKTQYHDSLINMLLDQQKELRENQKKCHSSIDITWIEQRISDSVWTKIDSQNRDFAESKFIQFKQIVEQNHIKQKEKDTVMWTIVNECKGDVDKLTQKINQINQQIQEMKEKSQWGLKQLWRKQ